MNSNLGRETDLFGKLYNVRKIMHNNFFDFFSVGMHYGVQRCAVFLSMSNRYAGMPAKFTGSVPIVSKKNMKT